MAKAKKERTPEQIAATKERMAKVRAARQNKNPQTNIPTIEAKDETPETVVNPSEDNLPEQTAEGEFDQPAEAPVPSPDTIDTTDMADLVKQIQELKDMQFLLMTDQIKKQAGGKPLVSNGQLTGTVEKYIVDPAYYPDPRERLTDEPRLKRFAFDMNYELEWEISESRYETIDHIRQVEPKFTVTLVGRVVDEETGEFTDQYYAINRLIMHEDPSAAVIIAADMGLDIPRDDERVFLNEMRYIRIRDWLIGCFYPPTPSPEKEKRDMVVNGKLVQVYTKSVDDHAGKGGLKKHDWDNLAKVKF